MVDQFVPVSTNLRQLYPTVSSLETLELRYQTLKDRFQEIYGTLPSFFARAPGRVNLIGEHVDYSGYGVLPMALQYDVVIAVKPNNNNQLHLSNIESERFPAQSFPKFPSEIIIERSKLTWHHYFLAGYKAILEKTEQTPCGLYVLIDGNVPRGSGLSSSSALVCASALAIMFANQLSLSRIELADLTAKCEQYVGAESGGMDQAISFLAEAGSAKFIQFNPLRSINVTLPPGACFVIANCLVEHSLQSQLAGANYNIRVVECRVSAVVLSHFIGLDWKGKNIRMLSDIQKHHPKTFKDLLNYVEKYLHKEPYTKNEVANLLGISVSELVSQFFGRVDFERMELYSRSKHVFSESLRVEKFCQLCQNPSAANLLEQLGQLMNESQESCDDLYDCSCLELNSLVTACRKAGALGARLTGAGWGGWVICLVAEANVENLIHQVKESFFSAVPPSERHLHIFPTKPAQGAGLFVPN